MTITFTHTEYHPEPEQEAIWILTVDVDVEMYTDGNQDTFGCYVANIQTALTHEGPVKISDIEPRLLAKMEQAAIQWINDGRESLGGNGVLTWRENGLPLQYAARKGRWGFLCVANTHAECFNALLQHIKSPQTQS